MEPNRFVRILRKGWAYVAAFAVLGLVGGGLAAVLTPVQYSSATRLFVAVQIAADSTTSELVQGNNFAVQKVLSYVDVVTSPRVLDTVIAELGLDTTSEDLARDITAEVQPNSVVIEIAAAAPTAADAAELAGATADSFADVVVNELEAPADGSASPVKVEVLQPAVESSTPALPQVPFNLALGLLIGLVVGVILALVIGLLDRRVHSRLDIARITDLPILGAIRTDPRMRKRPLTVRDEPRGETAEEFRTLRTNVQSVGFEGGARSIVVTSPLAKEGTSVTVANLALSLADAGSSVVMVDADLRGAGVSTVFAVPADTGLTEVLTRRISLEDAIQSGGPRLAVLSSGAAAANPSELLGSAEMASVLASLTKRFDYVLIDAPPVLPVTDSAVLSRLAGATVLIVGSRRVRDDEVVAAIGSLADAGGTVIGVVLTMTPTRGPDAGIHRGKPSRSTRKAGATSIAPTARRVQDDPRKTVRSGRGREDRESRSGSTVKADHDPRVTGGV